MLGNTPIKSDRPQSVHNESNVYVWVEHTFNPESKFNSQKYGIHHAPYVSYQLMCDIYDNYDNDNYETYPIKFDKEMKVEYILTAIRKLYQKRYGKSAPPLDKFWSYLDWNLEYYAYIINKAAIIAPEEVRESVILFNHCSKEIQVEILFNWIDLVVRKTSEEDDNSHNKKGILNEEKDFDKEAIKIIEQLEKV